MKFLKTQKGFTILYAVLISGLLLSIGIGVYNIAIKELKLSVVGANSQVAIFAADTGLECALYWELSDEEGFAADQNEPPAPVGMNCMGNNNLASEVSFTSAPWAPTGNRATTTFVLNFPEGYCARVYVGKDRTTDKITVESRGYNMACDSNSIKKVERALRVTIEDIGL